MGHFISGASTVYNLTKYRFKVYLRGRSVMDAIEWEYDINWIAIGFIC